jgi:hypothetical protein
VSRKLIVGVAACLCALFLAACGDKKEDKPASGGGGAAPAKTEASGPEVKLDPATAGVIKGKIKFGNQPSKMPGPIDMGAKAKECGTEGSPKVDEYYVVGENNAAANVMVYVKSGPAKNVKTPTPTTEAVLDQVHCMYTPRVLCMRAGQPLRVKSSDPTSHNVHMTGKLNGDWNQTMAPNTSFLAGEGSSKPITNPESQIRVKCDIHTWMQAFVGAFTHDAFAVTTKDGNYELKNLPPGDYEIEVWHERAKAKPQKVTVGAKETKELNFEMKFEE